MTVHDTVRMGIIGCGRIADYHAAAVAKLDGAVLTACCDVDFSRAEALSQRYGAPFSFADCEQMLLSGSVDAVLVCTPHPQHLVAVKRAAEAGVHVLCEKPMTVDLAEADEMIAATEAAGVRFGVIFQRRFYPAAQRIRTAIDEDKLGRVSLGECQVRIWRSPEYYASDPWRGMWATEGGGVMMNQAIHFIDLLEWYMGDIREVHARWGTFRHGAHIDVEDTLVATLVSESGALATVAAASTFEPELGFGLTIHGNSGATVGLLELPEATQALNHVWTVEGETELREKWEEEDRGHEAFPRFHELQIADFVSAVVEDREPEVTGREARKSLELVVAMYESARTGRTITLPL